LAKGITDAEKLKLMLDDYSNHCNKYLEYSKTEFPELFPGHNLLTRVLWSLHCSNEDCLESISTIIGNGDLLSSITICRTMFESVIDMGLLSKKDEKEANKYLGFGTIDRYKVLINKLKLPNQKVDENTLKNMEEEIKKYLSIYYSDRLRRNKFVIKELPRNWCNKDMLQRVKEVDKKYFKSEKNVFENYYLNVYRVGSFAVHRNSAAFDLCNTFVKKEKKLMFLLREDTFITTMINSLKLFLISLYMLNENLDKDKKIFEYVNAELKSVDEKFNKFYS